MKNKRKETKEEKALWYTGYNYLHKGEYEKAKKFFNEAINKQNDETGYLMMGILNDKLKKYNEAIENFTMYIEHSNDNKRKSNGYGHRGLTKLKTGLNKEAIDDLMKAIELAAENRKKDINQEELNKFHKILKTYKDGNVNNPENRKYDDIPLDISLYFKWCICDIGQDNKRALKDLQHLSNIYSEISNENNK